MIINRPIPTFLTASGLAIAALIAVPPTVTQAATDASSGTRPTAIRFAPAITNQLVRNDAIYGVSCTSWTQCMAVGTRAYTSALAFRPLAEQWNGRRWRVLPMPGPVELARTQVAQVSCRFRRFCVAVGYHYRVGGPGYAVLAEHWTGTRWQIIQARNPLAIKSAFLNDVSCDLRVGCMAVGGDVTPSGEGHALAEWWAHGRWQVLRVPTPPDAQATQLDGISCGGSVCMAVGMYANASGQILTLAERWTGRSWRWMRPPNAHTPISALQRVSCHSASLCMAVGASEWTNERPLAELWTNGRWRRVPGGRLAGGVLNGVSCPGAAWCIAVGSVGADPLTEAWSGSAWRVLHTPRASGRPADELNDLSCRTMTVRCISVGARYEPGTFVKQATLAEWWSGKKWRVMTTSNP